MAKDVIGKRLVHITTIPLSLLVLINGQITFMKAQGFDVHGIAAPSKLSKKVVEKYDIPLHEIPMTREISPFKDLLSLWRLTVKLAHLKPDIVHSHTPKGGLLGMIAAWFNRVPVRIFHLHGLRYSTTRGIKRCILMLSDKLACTLAHQVLIVSHSVREQAIDDGMCTPEKSHVLVNGSINGVDAINVFNPAKFDATTSSTIRKQYQIPTDVPVIGIIGRIVRDKGIIEFVQAWQKLRDKFPMSHCLLVGPFETSDPIPQQVCELIQNDNRIHITGFVEHHSISSLLSTIDVLAFPSHREGFPISLLEASAMAVPIVTTDAVGCIDAVIHGVTGLIVPVRDADALHDALTIYLSDKALCQAHGKAGRERVLRDFKPDTIWHSLLEMYQQLMHKLGN
ncbi:MAG: glycosyltransferase family 4 protein [Chloroflexota bacterium]